MGHFCPSSPFDTPSQEHGLCPPLGLQPGFLLQCSVETPAEGLKVEGVRGLGFKGSGVQVFRFLGCSFVGFRVFRVFVVLGGVLGGKGV